MKMKAVAVALTLVAVQATLIGLYAITRPSTSRPPATLAPPPTPRTLPLPTTWPAQRQARLVHVWATWCAPCRDELPELLAADLGVAVVAVSVDENDAVVAHHFGGAVPENVVRASAADVERDFGVSHLPVTFLVDEADVVVGEDRGARDWSDARRLIAARRAAR